MAEDNVVPKGEFNLSIGDLVLRAQYVLTTMLGEGGGARNTRDGDRKVLEAVRKDPEAKVYYSIGPEGDEKPEMVLTGTNRGSSLYLVTAAALMGAGLPITAGEYGGVHFADIKGQIDPSDKARLIGLQTERRLTNVEAAIEEIRPGARAFCGQRNVVWNTMSVLQGERLAAEYIVGSGNSTQGMLSLQEYDGRGVDKLALVVEASIRGAGLPLREIAVVPNLNDHVRRNDYYPRAHMASARPCPNRMPSTFF